MTTPLAIIATALAASHGSVEMTPPPEIVPFRNMAGFRCLCCRRLIDEGVLWRVAGVGAWMLCLDCARRVGQTALKMEAK